MTMGSTRSVPSAQTIAACHVSISHLIAPLAWVHKTIHFRVSYRNAFALTTSMMFQTTRIANPVPYLAFLVSQMQVTVL